MLDVIGLFVGVGALVYCVILTITFYKLKSSLEELNGLQEYYRTINTALEDMSTIITNNSASINKLENSVTDLTESNTNIETLVKDFVNNSEVEQNPLRINGYAISVE